MVPTSGAHKVRSDRTGPPQCLLHRPLPRLALVLSVPASGQPFSPSESVCFSRFTLVTSPQSSVWRVPSASPSPLAQSALCYVGTTPNCM